MTAVTVHATNQSVGAGECTPLVVNGKSVKLDDSTILTAFLVRANCKGGDVTIRIFETDTKQAFELATFNLTEIIKRGTSFAFVRSGVATILSKEAYILACSDDSLHKGSFDIQLQILKF